MMVGVDRKSAEPPNEQLTRQITRLIADGELERGARLPTVRQLAADLALAPNTVVRCYADLEANGLIITSGRRGTSVLATKTEARAKLRDEVLRAAHAFAAMARNAGVSGDEALTAVRSAFGEASI